jgi:membrane protein implicated in regulation of membrane protease activity
MSPRPRFTSRMTRARNAVLGVVLRPFRWFSPATQLVLGFIFLVVVTTLLLSKWPLTLNSAGLLVLVLASYLVVWRFVESREAVVDLSISKRRAFALVGSAQQLNIHCQGSDRSQS